MQSTCNQHAIIEQPTESDALMKETIRDHRRQSACNQHAISISVPKAFMDVATELMREAISMQSAYPKPSWMWPQS